MIAEINQTRQAIDALSIPTTDKARDADRLESLASLNEQLRRSCRRRSELEAQLAAAASAEPDRATILKAISDLETLWDHLTISERGRMMQLLIERIDHDPTDSSCSITLSPTGLGSFGNPNDEASS